MVSALSAALGAALLVVTAGALACALGVRDRAGFPAALLVLAAGTVVLQTIALSIVGAFTPAGLLVAGGARRRCGRGGLGARGTAVAAGLQGPPRLGDRRGQAPSRGGPPCDGRDGGAPVPGL